MSALQWRPTGYGSNLAAYSGELMVAMVMSAPGEKNVWQISAVISPYRSWRHRGYVKSPAAGRRAVQRAWSRWLEHANLQEKRTPKL